MSTKRKIIVPSREEDAEINAQINADPDDMEWTDEMFAQAKPVIETDPEFVAKWNRVQGKLKYKTIIPSPDEDGKFLVQLSADPDDAERIDVTSARTKPVIEVDSESASSKRLKKRGESRESENVAIRAVA